MPSLDETDYRILKALQDDARLSFSAISRLIHLSTPSVAQRVRRMEESGVITGYVTKVNPRSVGWTVDAIVRLDCHRATCILNDSSAINHPNILEINRVTGPYCSVLRVHAATMSDYEQLVDHLTRYGTPTSELILSSQISDVTIPQE